MPSHATEQSVHEHLVGVSAIATVVDAFIDRIMDDPRLLANAEGDEAHHRVARAGFRYQATEMVCWAAGGPQTCTGKSMRDSHAHPEVTQGEWRAFLNDFRQTLG